jgi:hypothetical protein
MSKSIRIRTTPGGEDKYIKFKLDQDFDFLEILSLKLTQEDVYRRFYSDYGVVVGRVIMNNGVGVPNARVSIFIPVDENESDTIKTQYPYETVISKNGDGIRYNLLPNSDQDGCHVSVGTFPSKRDILDNEVNLEVFEKYYKYSSTTNDAGDFMIFGVPVGNHTINIDADISDIGIFSQKPYDLIEEGTPEKMFNSTTQFKRSKNLNILPQIKNQKTGVNVLPFWGDKQRNEVGITRIDFDVNYNLKPKAIFIGSTFTDTEKNSVNKNCETRKKAGKVCETVPNGGRLSMVRKTINGDIEPYYVNSDIDGDGVWAYQVPMNLDYMITDEFGKLIPTEEPNKGIPTRTTVRFRLESDITGGEGRLRTRADYLIPHNPKNKNEIDYEFGEQTKDSSFRDLYWNKIYTVKNFIPRYQGNDNGENRNFIGLKDVDDCVGTKNPIPFNRLDSDFNPLYVIICILVSVFIDILGFVNSILNVMVVGKRICDRGDISCARIKCDEKYFAPKCKGTCYDNTRHRERSDDGPWESSVSKAKDCFQITLAEALNVYELDFYNDWINGSVYSVLLKYKKKKKKEKFCDVDGGGSQYLVDSLTNNKFEGFRDIKIEEGIVKNYKGELFYAPTTKDAKYKLFATDIVNLGSINGYDWQGQPSLQEYLIPTTYKTPPLTGLVGEGDDYTPMADYGKEGKDENAKGLFFDLSCTKVKVNPTQAKNIKRLSEIGVGLDEDRFDEPDGKGKDGAITNDDIDFQIIRDRFIQLNNPNINSIPDNGLSSNFSGQDYIDFRDFSNNHIKQPENSLFFYFGTQPNKTAIEKMNKKYFENCMNLKRLDYGEE